MTAGHFLIGVLSIVLIDLLLAGDNALVIAMAVRSLPRRERRIGTVVRGRRRGRLRVALTAVAARLLSIPYRATGGRTVYPVDCLQGAGGRQRPARRAPVAERLLQAIWYIVVADITMSTDNVLAIAGASKGNI